MDKKTKKVNETKTVKTEVNKEVPNKKTNAAVKPAEEPSVTKTAPDAAEPTVKESVAVAADIKTTEEIKAEKPVTVTVVKKRSVLFVASEANPFIGTGGLADVIGSLPKELAASGKFDVKVILPLYAEVDKAYRANFTFEGNFNVPLAWRNQYCGLFSFKYCGVTFLFIDNEYYFRRKGIYGFYDDGERFAFFSKAVLESMQFMNYYPEIMHCHDWQTALSVIYLKTLYAGRYGFDHIKALFTVHNIEYQGKYGFELLGDLFGLPDSCRSAIEYDGCINLMKGAIQLADRFSTVSPRYASEIKNPYFAHGLENVTSMNEYKLCGILNGIDVSVYNPATDGKLFANYTADNPENKQVCKSELQKMLALPLRENVPVVAIISRLVSHKGFDLIKCVFEELLSEDVQVIILGKGDSEYEDYFRFIAQRYSGKCRAIVAYNKDLASKIYSGSDIFLMPSKQEPCGLSQMIACRYGSVPVVRETGGLADSIIPFNNDKREGGNGFVFRNYNAHEMLYVLKDAIFTYGNKSEWAALMKRAMLSDFSWKKSAAEYERLYTNMLI